MKQNTIKISILSRDMPLKMAMFLSALGQQFDLSKLTTKTQEKLQAYHDKKADYFISVDNQKIKRS